MRTFNSHVNCDNSSISCRHDSGVITDSNFDPTMSCAKYARQSSNHARLIEVHST
jgi:hypothetical protein